LTIKEGSVNIFKRKMIVGVITSILLSLALGIIKPYPLSSYELAEFQITNKFIANVIGSTLVYILYSIPIIHLYGTISSFLCDYFSKLLSEVTNKNLITIYSAIFHVFFGLVPSYYSVFTSVLHWYCLWVTILFFIVDLFLKRFNKNFSFIHVIISWGILILICISMMSYISFLL
jgi:hypothetical protein